MRKDPPCFNSAHYTMAVAVFTFTHAVLPEDGDLTGVCSELRSQTQEMHSGVFSNCRLVMYTFTLLVSVYHCMQEPLHVRHVNDY